MGGQSGQQTTTNSNPPWMDAASQNMLGAAGQTVNGAQQNPLQTGAYASADMYGQMAPGALGQSYNVMTQNANFQPNTAQWLGPLGSMLGGSVSGMPGGAGTPHAGGGGGGLSIPAAQAQTFTMDPSQMQNVDPHSILDYNMSDYMNPYTQNVIDNQSSDIERARQTQGVNDSATAMGAGAYGGSRSGVVSALTNSEYDRNQAANSAQMWDQAYGNAQGLAQGDANAANQADEFNANQNYQMMLANAGFQNTGSQFNAGQANTLSGDTIAARAQTQAAATAAQASMYGAGLNAQNQRLSTMINGALGYGQLGLGADLNGATLRGNTAGQLMNFGQGGINAQGGAGDAIYNQPFNDLGWASGVLGNVPHGSSSSQPIYHNRGAGALGGAASGAAAGTAIMPGWGTAIGAVGGGLMGYFGS